MTPRARVEALLEAARRAFGPSRPPDRAAWLAEEAGLGAPVVADALDRLLELSPTREALDAFVARARPAPEVLVVLSANVPTAPLRAIAWGLAASAKVTVRTSRRARRFVDLLLAELDPPAFAHAVVDDHAALVATVAALPPTAAVHVYGGAAAVAALTEAAAPRRCEAHGPGFGAIYLEGVPGAAVARALADDVAAFDQRGCLSPRVVLVRGDSAATARALAAALSDVGGPLPRAPLDETLRAAIRRLADAATMVGHAHVGPHHGVFDLAEAPPTLSPGGRTLTVHQVADRAEAERALGALGPALTGVATDLPPDRPLALPRGVRRAAPGALQRPPFDGPVDLRPLLVFEEGE